MSHRTRITTAIAVSALLALGLVGCSSESKSSSASSAAAPAQRDAATDEFAAAGSAPAAAAASAAATTAAPAAGGGSTTPAVLANRQIVYTADITIRATSVQDAVTQIEAIASSPTTEGAVYAEQIDLTPKDADTADATITLKVPPTALEGTLDRIARLGTELSRDEKAADVTTQVSDVSARLTAAHDSLNRLEQLFQHAGTVGDLTNLEAQIAQRESDLDSLESQQKALSAEVAQATLTATVVAMPAVATKTKHTHVFGFLRGLRGGWHAFTRTTAALATAVGAALPFLVVLAVLAALALLSRRLIRRRPRPAAAPTTQES